tara:strand:- start:158 stop:562 length:405 start_codon:yes stop_codon:yes gene_type:complete
MNNISIKGKTKGASSTEGKLTIGAISCGIFAIVSQVIGSLFFNVDLNIDIDSTLQLLTGGGAIYALARTGLKASIAFAQGKVNSKEKEKASNTPTEKPAAGFARAIIPDPKPASRTWPTEDMTAPIQIGQTPMS